MENKTLKDISHLKGHPFKFDMSDVGDFAFIGGEIDKISFRKPSTGKIIRVLFYDSGDNTWKEEDFTEHEPIIDSIKKLTNKHVFDAIFEGVWL